jgi:predicted metal-binding membrane protein
MTPEARERRRIRTPVVAVTALAWVLLVLADPPWSAPGAGHGAVMVPGMGHAGHEAGRSATGLAIGGLLMLTAMMAPLLIPAIRHARVRSLRRRRGRAVALVVLAHAAVWAVGSALLLAVASWLRAGTAQDAQAVLAGLVVAVAWQASPLKQTCLNRHCATPPLACFGWRADRDSLRFGATHAAWCLGACWALMLVALLVPAWHLAVMLLVSGWMWVEPFDRPARPSWRLRLPLRFLRIVALKVRSVPRRVAAV